MSITAPASLLYDGHCRLCRAGSAQLLAWSRPGSVQALDFQAPGVLERFPGLTHEACMQAIQLVTPEGRVLRASEAVVAVLLSRGWVCAWAQLYYVPGLRQLVDLAYAWIARNRYRFFGRTPCEDGACSLHFKP